MIPRYIIRLNGAPPRFLGPNLAEVHDRKLALIGEYEPLLARVTKRFGERWTTHATLEEVPYEEMFAYYGRLGQQKRNEPKNWKEKLRTAKGLKVYRGKIKDNKEGTKPRDTYICAYSLEHACELMEKLGVTLNYHQIYRRMKKRKNFHFDPQLEPTTMGVWRKTGEEWRKVV